MNGLYNILFGSKKELAETVGGVEMSWTNTFLDALDYEGFKNHWAEIGQDAKDVLTQNLSKTI